MPIEGLHLLADIPRHWAPRRPDKAATVFEDRAVTWADFDVLCSQVANGIIEAGNVLYLYLLGVGLTDQEAEHDAVIPDYPVPLLKGMHPAVKVSVK